MQPSEPKPTLSPARLLYVSLSLALAAVLLYFSLRGLDWSSVLATLRSVRPERLALWFAFIIILSFPLRAARWRILLSATRPGPLRHGFLGNLRRLLRQRLSSRAGGRVGPHHGG